MRSTSAAACRQAQISDTAQRAESGNQKLNRGKPGANSAVAPGQASALTPDFTCSSRSCRGKHQLNMAAMRSLIAGRRHCSVRTIPHGLALNNHQPDAARPTRRRHS